MNLEKVCIQDEYLRLKRSAQKLYCLLAFKWWILNGKLGYLATWIKKIKLKTLVLS